MFLLGIKEHHKVHAEKENNESRARERGSAGLGETEVPWWWGCPRRAGLLELPGRLSSELKWWASGRAPGTQRHTPRPRSTRPGNCRGETGTERELRQLQQPNSPSSPLPSFMPLLSSTPSSVEGRGWGEKAPNSPLGNSSHLGKAQEHTTGNAMQQTIHVWNNKAPKYEWRLLGQHEYGCDWVTHKVSLSEFSGQ